MLPGQNQYHVFEQCFLVFGESKCTIPIFIVVDEAIEKKTSCLVHCMRGRSRSSALVIGYLMKRNNWSLREAYFYAKERRPKIGPHLDLKDQLREYDIHRYGKSSMEMNDFVK